MSFATSTRKGINHRSTIASKYATLPRCKVERRLSKIVTEDDRRVAWLDLSMERLCLHIAVNSIFHERHKNCSCISVVRHPAGLQEHVMAICPSGIPPKKCNASLKRRVPKSNLLFY